MSSDCASPRATKIMCAARLALRRRRPVHGDRPHPHAECFGRCFRQRHRRAWRGFRRYLRGWAGACRRRDRAGGSGGVRAASSRWRRRAARHCRRHRSVVPVEPGGAEGGSQGRLSSDRDFRRHGRGRRRRRGARPQCRSKSSMRSASPAAWRAASSNISPRAPGPSGCMPAGRRNRGFARRCWRGRVFSVRARCSRACTGCSTVSPIPATAITTR